MHLDMRYVYIRKKYYVSRKVKIIYNLKRRVRKCGDMTLNLEREETSFHLDDTQFTGCVTQ